MKRQTHLLAEPRANPLPEREFPPQSANCFLAFRRPEIVMKVNDRSDDYEIFLRAFLMLCSCHFLLVRLWRRFRVPFSVWLVCFRQSLPVNCLP